MKYLEFTTESVKQIIFGVSISLLLLVVIINVCATYYGGNADVNVQSATTIVNLAEGTAATDAVTRAYLLAKKPYYEGATSTAISGNLGGVDGANSKCNGNYSGSHMCSQGELIAAGVQTNPASGWIACNLFDPNITTGNGLCMGSGDAVDISDTSNLASCNFFTSGSSSYSGAKVGTAFNLVSAQCESTNYILCCS